MTPESLNEVTHCGIFEFPFSFKFKNKFSNLEINFEKFDIIFNFSYVIWSKID